MKNIQRTLLITLTFISAQAVLAGNTNIKDYTTENATKLMHKPAVKAADHEAAASDSVKTHGKDLADEVTSEKDDGKAAVKKARKPSAESTDKKGE